MLGPVLFNNFINDLDDVTKCTLSKFVHDIELGGMADILAGCAVTQRDLGWLDKWANRNFMKFIKEKPKVLHWWKNNSMYLYMLRVTQLENSLAESDLVQF